MKKYGVMAIFLSVIFSFSFNAAAADSDTGFYVGLLGGVVVPTGMSTTISNIPPGGRTVYDNISLNSGYLFGVKAGYLMPFSERYLAAELEYNHFQNDFDTGKTYSLNGKAVNFDSKVKADAFMANLIGRFPRGKFHPYFGAGLGYAKVKLDDINASSVGTFSGDTQGVFAWQILAGVDYDITKNIFAGLGYKYFVTSKASYGSMEATYISHNILLTIGYKF